MAISPINQSAPLAQRKLPTAQPLPQKVSDATETLGNDQLVLKYFILASSHDVVRAVSPTADRVIGKGFEAAARVPLLASGMRIAGQALPFLNGILSTASAYADTKDFLRTWGNPDSSKAQKALSGVQTGSSLTCACLDIACIPLLLTAAPIGIPLALASSALCLVSVAAYFARQYVK